MKQRVILFFILLLVGFLFLFAYAAFAEVKGETAKTPVNLQIPIPKPGEEGKFLEQLINIQRGPCKDLWQGAPNSLQDKDCLAIPWIAEYIVAWYRWLVSIVAIIAVIAIMWGGIKWITASGDASQIKSAKDTIFNALIGLFILVTAHVFLRTINPQLVQLKGIIIPGVTRISLGGGMCSVEQEEYDSLAPEEKTKRGGVRPQNAWCGKRLNPVTGDICWSMDPDDKFGRKTTIGDKAYQECCQKSLEKDGVEVARAKDCCVGDGCGKEAICLVDSPGYMSSGFSCKQGMIAIDVTCNTNKGGQHADVGAQLWVACQGSKGSILVERVLKQSAPECIENHQVFVFTAKDFLKEIGAPDLKLVFGGGYCGGCQCDVGGESFSPLGYFIAILLDDPDGADTLAGDDIYFVGKHQQPFHKKPDTLGIAQHGIKYLGGYVGTNNEVGMGVMKVMMAGQARKADTRKWDSDWQLNLWSTHDMVKQGNLLKVDATKRGGSWATD